VKGAIHEPSFAEPGAIRFQPVSFHPRSPISLDARSNVTRERTAARPGNQDLQRAADLINALHVTGSNHLTGLTKDIEPFIEIANQELAYVRSVTDAAHEIWTAQTEQRPVGLASIQLINDLMRHTPTLELRSGGFATSFGERPNQSPKSTLALLIRPLLDAIAMGEASSLRVCANRGCGSVFIDTTPMHRRKWCEMATCGNRAKAARHRARQRQGTSADSAGREPGKKRTE